MFVQMLDLGQVTVCLFRCQTWARWGLLSFFLFVLQHSLNDRCLGILYDVNDDGACVDGTVVVTGSVKSCAASWSRGVCLKIVLMCVHVVQGRNNLLSSWSGCFCKFVFSARQVRAWFCCITGTETVFLEWVVFGLAVGLLEAAVRVGRGGV